MLRTCFSCGDSFAITDDDLTFYETLSPVFAGKRELIPPPTLCPDCRQQRRLMYRNERNFYRRTCGKTGRAVISVYAPDQPCIVYDQPVWWSDDWDQLATGRDIDFSRPFFEQFHELSLAAPRPCIMNMGSENSQFTHHAPYNKNCYMCVNSGYNEDCYYLTSFSVHNRDCADSLFLHGSERCAECVNVKQSTSSHHLVECINCSDSAFCFDCQSCDHCFECFNLRHKQYCIRNEQLTKEQYEARMREFDAHTEAGIMRCEQDFRTLMQRQAIHRNVIVEQSEQSSGDHLFQCKNARQSYYMFDAEDCAHCYDCGDLKTSMDAVEPFHGELQYESNGCNLGYSLCGCSKCYECRNSLYCEYSFSCSDCFGCFGLRRQKYCILNKQYAKEEYENLVPKIIAHMRATGEFGEFFPVALSPFAYNETTAQDFYPLTKEAVLEKGWRWRDETDELPKVDRVIPAAQLPDSIDDVPDDILNWAIECEITKRPFKIIKQELAFYRTMRLPVPRLHPDERHRRRMALRNPRKLWNRECMKCGKEMQTAYNPERPEIVFCERCYLETVY